MYNLNNKITFLYSRIHLNRIRHFKRIVFSLLLVYVPCQVAVACSCFTSGTGQGNNAAAQKAAATPAMYSSNGNHCAISSCYDTIACLVFVANILEQYKN